MTKLRTIELSMRCFVFGLVSLIPILGLPLSVLALVTFRKLLSESAGQWNPAKYYWIWGAILGGIGGLISVLAFGAILVSLVV